MSKKHKKREWHLPKLSLPVKVGLGFVLFVTVASLIMFIVGVVINGQDSGNGLTITDAQKRARDEAVRKAQHDGAIYDSAKQALESGDDEKANSIYNDAINNESDGTRKVELAIDQSRALSAQGKASEAVAVAKKAESYSSDKFLIADWLSKLYEYQRKYSMASVYYTLAGKWADSPTNKTGYDKAYYDTQAQRMNVLAGKS